MTRTKWYESRPGETSAGRIMYMTVTVVGCAIAIAGAVGVFLSVPEAFAISGVGAGMAGGAIAGKGYQTRQESRDQGGGQ